MNYIDVAVPTPLPRTFTYQSAADVRAGQRVLVPFGHQKLVGVVLGPAAATGSTDHEFTIKDIEQIIDQDPIYSARSLELARWLSAYYLHPLGEVLRTMLPASQTKSVNQKLRLTDAGLVERDQAATASGRLLAKLIHGNRHEIQAPLLRKKWLALQALGDIDASFVTVEELLRTSLLSEQQTKKLHARRRGVPETGGTVGAQHMPDPGMPTSKQVPPTLTAAQAAILARLCQEGLASTAPGKSTVALLHGVTGSGKTEIYLRLIAEILPHGAQPAGQALVMVPEISLTPQMTRVFERRFPGQVAVVHSGMSDHERWAQLDRIRSGEAAILIGPRSAVFGPFRDLKLIIVDEEHDSSYKQTTGLAYHGRDVAIVRGKLEGALVLLGSATPSLESYHNATSGRYLLLELPERVTGRPLPMIEVIDGDADEAPKGRGLFGTLVARQGEGRVAPPPGGDADDLRLHPQVLAALQDNLARREQAIVLVNRRGYAYYLFSLEQKQAVQCPHCSISMTLHARSTILRCHYCDHQTSVAKVIRERPAETLVAVGHGSQKAEEALAKQLPEAKIVRLDSDSVGAEGHLASTLERFRSGSVDILVGTQILAKGHDFPNVTLIVILEVDQLLGLPDFRAGERTFQLLVQASGRAGRAELPGRVLVQSLRASHPIVAAALQQDFHGYARLELDFRRLHAYPPFSRLIAIEFSSTDQRRLTQLCRAVEDFLERLGESRPELMRQVRVLGPAIPPIETIRKRHRRHVVLAAAKPQALRDLAQAFLGAFAHLPRTVRMKIDVDPQSLI